MLGWSFYFSYVNKEVKNVHRKTVEKNQAERMNRQDHTFSEFAHRGIRIKVPIKHIMYSFKGGHVFVFHYLDIKRDRNQIKAFCMTNRR
jgi:hypothetical protein